MLLGHKIILLVVIFFMSASVLSVFTLFKFMCGGEVVECTCKAFIYVAHAFGPNTDHPIHVVGCFDVKTGCKRVESSSM